MSRFERQIGSYPEQPSPGGPLLIVTGGLHGNEPGGVHAAERVLAQLRHARPSMRGRFVALAGNLAALELGERLARRDLNRIWTPEEVERVRGMSADELEHEALEQRELLEELDRALADGRRPAVLLDLHSTSADGAPFAIMSDTLQNRRYARALPIPVILGLEERVVGTLLSWFAEQGHVALCVEGGQNELKTTVDHHEAAIWILLVAAGMLAPADVPSLAAHEERLRFAAGELPRVLELLHREAVPQGGSFSMRPGYANFQRVHAGEVLATVARPDGGSEELAAPLAGLLFLPRYQGQGDDAFFVGREVKGIWLHLSAGLRRLKLEWMLPLLPGISRVPDAPRHLRVDPVVARWYALEILHLFGYRRRAREGHGHEFVRRLDLP